jgi:crossover junction endodeoxyribonuclease RuvC
MRILGIDCGSERTGYGVVESDGRRHRLVAAGVIRVSPKKPFAERLRLIYVGVREVLDRDRPERFAVETVFHGVNAKSALKLAQVRGVVMLAAAEVGLAVEEYSPLEIKGSVVGHGHATKDQVQMMTASLLGLREIIEPHDASDALAVAICYATRGLSLEARAIKAPIHA